MIEQLDPEDEDELSRPLRHQPHGVIGLILVLALVMGIAYYFSHRSRGSDTDSQAPTAPPSVEASVNTVTVDDPALDVAVSDTLEDSVYPNTGDPGVDSLHYDLALDWAPATRTLTGESTLTFRATSDDSEFQLDLEPALKVDSVEVDGESVPFTHDGKDLVITAPVKGGKRYQARISYSGTPEPVNAPTSRSDVPDLGWHITGANETWTMQEPLGAYSWFPVNDQPSDKALYDITLSVPSPMVGVANGELVSTEEVGGVTTNTFHLDEPASSYLITTAFGAFEQTELTSDSGVPITLWTPTADPTPPEDLRELAPLLTWAEERLGPYPFSTLGAVLVDSNSAMETQTMLTLGNRPFVREPEVLLHELVHQWYGDQVTPRDWRDVWMSEGMTMYLQGVYEAEQENRSIDDKMDDWAQVEVSSRRQFGPPGDYAPQEFGQANIYYGPALMWNELRHNLGDKRFWELVRAWPAVHDSGELTTSADRDEYYDWIEDFTGEELSAVLRRLDHGRHDTTTQLASTHADLGVRRNGLPLSGHRAGGGTPWA